MTISEWIDSVQTIAVWFTSATVFWYTYETYRLRQLSFLHTMLHAEHVLKSLPKDEFSNITEMSFVEPVFRWEGGSFSEGRIVSKFVNKGASISNLRIHPMGRFKAEITPGTVRTHDTGQFSLSGFKSTEEKPKFVLEFRTNIGLLVTQTYECKLSEARIVKLSTYY